MYKLNKIWMSAAGACLFNFIFWHEKLGINAFLYDAFIIVSTFILYPEAKKNTTVRWLLLMQTICVGMVIMLNTLLSKIALSLVLLLFIGFAEYVHRSILFAAGSLLLNTVLVFDSFPAELQKREKSRKQTGLKKILLLSVIPVVIAFVFFLIYLASNSVLSDLTDDIASVIGDAFRNLFSWFSIGHFFFLVLGMYITGWLLLRSKSTFFSSKELKYKDHLERRSRIFRTRTGNVRKDHKTRRTGTRLFPVMTGLKNENTIGIICLILLNSLLFLVNGIDIIYVWFNYGQQKGINFSEEVHQGTELLIMSILFAIFVLLVFFNGNLNFYTRNKWLKNLAYAWIIQNSVLVCSVLIRDFYYIEHFGLAYKRIGVLFFLASVLGGLLTVFIKIGWKKTNYYLFRVNAWIAASLLVIATIFSWDELIANYNINHMNGARIDWQFLLSLSDKTIPILERPVVLAKLHQAEGPGGGDHEVPDQSYFQKQLESRKDQFLEEQKHYSWLSWNLSDKRLHQYLTTHIEPSPHR